MAAPFLSTIDAEAREHLLSVARPVAFAAGATIMRHGMAAHGAYLLREGEVEAVVTLPGGEQMTVARLGPGDMFGEMSLIELGTCTATIRATGAVEGWYVAHEDFRALVAMCHPAAIRLQHAVTAILAGRIAALNAQLMEREASEDRPARRTTDADPLQGVVRSLRAPFEAAGFVQRLPVFQRFTEAEIDEVLARASWLELPRGHAIFHAGCEAGAAFIVVRGAVEIVATRGERERRIAVLGPGQLVGYLSVLRGAAHSSHSFAREAAVLLELPAAGFRELYFGGSRTSVRMRSAVQASLLGSMGRTNRALTRLISQAQLEASHREEARLEAAYGSQLATAD